MIDHKKALMHAAVKQVMKIDGCAGVNISEPSGGDLERVSSENYRLVQENKDLARKLLMAVEALEQAKLGYGMPNDCACFICRALKEINWKAEG